MIGTRQAALFQAFRALAGHEQVSATTKTGGASKPVAKASSAKTKTMKAKGPVHASATVEPPVSITPPKKDMALTVHIEINLPAEASAETYDNIFKSIKANLLNE